MTALFASFGIVAVLAFVVSLLVLQAIVVMTLGIETEQMPLEALSEAMIAGPQNRHHPASTARIRIGSASRRRGVP